jgi:hypothetical protein
VARNNGTAPFYFLCPAGKGYCDDGGSCVFGRTKTVTKGEWATCEPLQNCGAPLDLSGCFPAAATVRVAGGGAKRMDELRVGDRVLAATPAGRLEYQDVYFFGHKDAAATARFVRLELAGGRALELTPDHFVPVLAAGVAPGLASARMTYARDVAEGDTVMVLAEGGGGLQAAAVVRASHMRRRGLFNPYTLGGTIVVDGVLASAHSSWVLDGTFGAAGASARLPAAYQALFAPLRAVYRMLGPAAMSAACDVVAAMAARLGAAAAPLSSGGAAAATAPAAAAAATAAAAAAATAVLKLRLRAAPAA